MNWTLQQIAAVVDGGLWDSVAIFVTWDDWGGWFDHVDPPVVETWDHSHAQRSADEFAEFDGQPFRYGSRVPCLVVGPYAKPGHISAQLNSHVSLLKFCQFTFDLDALTDRDAASHGMTDCIDTSQQPNAHP
jgi:phospholipase C